MSPPAAHLYEPAAQSPGQALLHLGPDLLYVGELGHLQAHAQASAVYLAGLYGPLRVRLPGGAWQRCRGAVIPAGQVHEIEALEGPVAVLYPSSPAATEPALSRLLAQPLAASGVPMGGHLGVHLGGAGETQLFRALYESPHSAHDTSLALHSLLHQRHQAPLAPVLDPRLARVMAQVQQAPQAQTSIEALATAQGLSASRLMHLFAQHTGTPYRRWRSWCRLQAAMRAAGRGQSLTHAALEAGFSDSQHFSHEFRRSLGLSASSLLQRVGRVSGA